MWIRRAVAAVVAGIAGLVLFGSAAPMTHDQPQAAQCRCMTHDQPQQ